MPDEVVPEMVDSFESDVDADASMSEDVCLRIVAKDQKRSWLEASVIEVGSLRWKPTLISPSKNAVLHVNLTDTLPSFVERRIVSASESGHQIYLALHLRSLYQEDVLRALSRVDANVYVLDDELQPSKPLHFLAALADYGVPVTPELRKEIGIRALAGMNEGSANKKGRRFEALLSFLLAQVRDLKVFSRNYRNATQEIDIVLQVDNLSDKVWCKPGVPFVLVEAKNTSQAIGQPVVSLLIRKLETKRGSSKLGMLFSMAGFTSDAKDEELRLSQTDMCIAMFDATGLRALLESDDLDEVLNQAVGRALLR